MLTDAPAKSQHVFIRDSFRDIQAAGHKYMGQNSAMMLKIEVVDWFTNGGPSSPNIISKC